MSTKDRPKKRRLSRSPKGKSQVASATPEKQQTIFSMFSKQKSELQSKEKATTSHSHRAQENTCDANIDSDSDAIQIVEAPHRIEKPKPQKQNSFEISADASSTSSLQSPYFSPEKNKKGLVTSRPQRFSKLSLKRKHKSEDTVLSSSIDEVTDKSHENIVSSVSIVTDETLMTKSKLFESLNDSSSGVSPYKSESDKRKSLSDNDCDKEQKPTPSSSKVSPTTDDDNDGSPCKSETNERKSLSENDCDKEQKPTPLRSIVSPTPDNDNDGDPDTKENGEVVYAVPYYLENFLLILKNILEDEYYSCLFNDDDMKCVQQFYDLSENSQKLYVRLFQRKNQWIRKSKIVYPKISEDLTSIFDELVSCKFLHDESELNDLEIILKTLQVPDLKQLGKSLRINTNQPQPEMIKAVLEHSKKGGIGAFFGRGGQKGITDVITKRAQGFLGKCYKLVQEKRTIFIRTLMLFSLHHATGEEDETGGGNQQLFQLLMSNIGRVVYPSFKIIRQQRVFNRREDLLRFETAMQINADMMEAMERNDFETTFDLYTDVKSAVEELWKNKDILRHDRSLPEHLRVFSASSIYAQCLTIGVEVLQKKRNYKDAVTLLEYLLGQLDYRPDYRGRWYDRLALNLDQHLKNPGKALDVIKKALADPRVRTGRRYSLFQRAQRLTHSKGKAHSHLQKRWKEFSDDVMASVKEAPKVTIQGRQMSCNALGYNWVTEESCTGESEDITFIKRVEEVALNHYAKIGYPQGLHGEGGTLTCLFGLYHWDLIFKDDISDVFHSPFQTYPLDIRTDHFYQARKEELEERLQKIKESPVEELHEMLEFCWKTHHGTIGGGINWERFEDVDHAKGLVSCMGGPVLSGILARVARDMRNTTSGVPDLIVWNTETKTFKVVEVKGPGDRLSTKQMLWLDYLVKLGVDAEVCYVEAVRAKKLKRLS